MRVGNILRIAGSAVCLFAASLMLHLPNASAQTQGPNGFDWIGTDPGAIEGQRCYGSSLASGGAFRRLISAWTPAASGNPNVSYTYSLNSFDAIVSVIPNGGQSAPAPSTFGWALYVYDSFEQFRQNANNNYRALYTFNVGSTGASFQPAPNCHFWAQGFTYNISCYRLGLNLSAASSTEFRTPQGQVTPVPLRLTGGNRYWFSLVGFGPLNTGMPCVLRTNMSMRPSPSPIPSVSFNMTAVQCAEAGLGEGCTFPVDHNDFYKLTPGTGYCDGLRTAVNYLPPDQAPQFNPTIYGQEPRSCGGATHPVCCERTMPALTAYKLSTTRFSQKLTSVQYAAFAQVIEPCDPPGC